MRFGFVLALMLAVFFVSVVQADVVIETVTIGNPGNAGELSGTGAGGEGPDRICGAVDYVYEIGKFEVTAGQYCEFLNAVAADDTYGLYNAEMDDHSKGCQITRHGTSGSYTYDFSGRPSGTEADWENRPVNFVSWGDAARFANWLHNGQPVGDQNQNTTEDGTYYLNGAMSNAELMAVVREPDATWVIPSEDEWYKAAYHYNDGATGNYFDYPTSSDSVPGYVNDSGNLYPAGTAFAEGGTDPGNYATYDGDGGDYGIGSPFYSTRVGEWENSSSPYGSYDQGGNMWEWNETVVGTFRGFRGGSYTYFHVPESLTAAYRDNPGAPASEYHSGGFRIALPPPAPDCGNGMCEPGEDSANCPEDCIGPVIATSLDQPILDFGGVDSSLEFEVWNSGDGTLHYEIVERLFNTAARHGGFSSVDVLPTEGSSTGPSQKRTHIVTVARGASGENVAGLRIDSAEAVNSPVGVELNAVSIPPDTTGAKYIWGDRESFRAVPRYSSSWAYKCPGSIGGCTPNAAAVVLGWWDRDPSGKYENIFPGGRAPGIGPHPFADSTPPFAPEPFVAAFRSSITSDSHCACRCEGGDCGAYNCLSDFIRTSKWLLGCGSTLSENLRFLSDFVNNQGEDTAFHGVYERWSDFGILKAEIDAGRPVIVKLHIDYEGEHNLGHSIVAYGYYVDVNNDKWFAVRDGFEDGNSDAKMGQQGAVQMIGNEEFWKWGRGNPIKVLGVTRFYPIYDGGIVAQTTCPVDLSIVDPNGDVIGKAINEIGEAIYIEEDLNGDGDLDDEIRIAVPLGGTYLISVIPETGAAPDALVTLIVEDRGQTTVLLDEVQVIELPTEPITVPVDVTPPIISVTAVPGGISSCDGGLVAVYMDVTVNDETDDTPEVILHSIEGAWDWVEGDVVGAVFGTDDRSFDLRAQCNGSCGQVYTVHYLARDDAGNLALASVVIDNAVNNGAEDCNSNDIPDECEISFDLAGDCNANGVPDECDIASGNADDYNVNDVPDDCEATKNRYVSLVTQYWPYAIALRVEIVESLSWPGSVGEIGWVGEPDEHDISRIVGAPVYLDRWPTVVHIGDCRIGPSTTYEVWGSFDGVDFVDPVTLATIARPGVKYWADIVGDFSGTWNQPNGVVNMSDIQAILQSFSGSETAPHLTWADLDGEVPNKIVNMTDVQQGVAGFKGEPYPFSDPADCP